MNIQIEICIENYSKLILTFDEIACKCLQNFLVRLHFFVEIISNEEFLNYIFFVCTGIYKEKRQICQFAELSQLFSMYV